MITKIVKWVTSDNREFNSETEALNHCKTITFCVGDRVRVNSKSGFNPGATGVVKYVEPNGLRIWVLRDGASSDVFFHSKELDLIK